MTPDQFAAARRKLGLSINEMATALSGDVRTIRRYEEGTRTPGALVQAKVEALLEGMNK